jgi:predicted transcriptional regulator
MKYLFYLSLVCLLGSCKIHAGLQANKENQSYYNFDQAMKRNESFTLGSAKEDLKALKDESSVDKKERKEKEKLEKILSKIEELKKNN